jgi:hypothetical protein
LRVFVSEFVSGGGWPENAVPGSLAVEGRAMLCAIVEDLSRIAGVRVETTWDARLGPQPFQSARPIMVESPADEMRHFERLAATCDATFVIAPEFDEILCSRCRIVENAGGRVLGPASRAVALCADKARLADHLREAGVDTIPTEAVVWNGVRLTASTDDAPSFPSVIKPRYGAGSQNTYLVNDADEFNRVRRECADCERPRQFIRQPYVAGRSVSVAMIFAPSRKEVEVFVPAEQRMSDDGRFRYLGGKVPIDSIDRAAVEATALAACRCVPGLRGYAGVDLIVPADSPHRPVVVEINPRLTTSYLGYRQLAEHNLAEWMLLPGSFQRTVHWRTGTVEFDTSGQIRRAGGGRAEAFET